jgi:hypothetical protein
MSADANMKLLYAVGKDSFFTLDTVEIGEAFDVIANVEIGADLNRFDAKQRLAVSILNVSQSTTLIREVYTEDLPPANDPHFQEIRVNFAGGWAADAGDLLQAVASYRVWAGLVSDYSHDETDRFIVV